MQLLVVHGILHLLGHDHAGAAEKERMWAARPKPSNGWAFPQKLFMNKIREFFISRAHSFEHAYNGWWYVLRTQRNAWIHAAFSTAVLLVALWLRLPLRDGPC